MAQTNLPWVERLFARMAARYGSAWVSKWAGIDIAAVKADWEDVLGSLYRANPQALVYGLEHLPEDFPPNSDAFLRICLGYRPPTERLPAPVGKPDPAVLAKVAKALEKAGGRDPGRECADRLRELRAEGVKLSAPQRAQLEALEAIGK